MEVTVTLFLKDCVRASLEDKTVIFVTHYVEFLSRVDRILVGLLSAQYLFNLLKKRIKIHDIILTVNYFPSLGLGEEGDNSGGNL
jgi:hypothetical protein